MTDLDKIIDSVVTLRASLNLDTKLLKTAERRLLRAHLEPCMLDLQRLLSHLIAPPDAPLEVASDRDSGAIIDQPYR